ncbi:MAG: allantoinase AllB [Cellvibrionaceae bacterium]|nr:allantoinase AllB [Cellvibrionaceae bacterium]|tara:strand:- start:9122 stop:10516 length:1395 start_codon:yes stop_codon:yes gene_type:complete
MTQRLAFHSQRVLLDQKLVPATVIIEDEIIVDIIADGEQMPATFESDRPESKSFEFVELGDDVLMPGLVDTHVHVNEPGRTEWEGFNTATSAAAAGGITTVVDMPLNCSPVTCTADALQQKLDSLENKLWIDCGFWGGVVPDHIDDLDALLKAGVLGVKSFTIHSGIDEFPQVEASDIARAIPILAKYDVPYLIHAELENDQQPSAEIGASYQSFLASRPRSWENDAIDMMIDQLEQARDNGVNGRVHIVHLSSADAIEAIEKARASGLQLTTETCPHYLTLFAESIPDGKTLYKCCPPIREDENRQRLWQGLADNSIDFIVSDHSPCTPELKHLDSGDIEKAWGGISSLQFGLAIIWTEAQKQGYTLEQVIDWMATRPAEFAGLGQQKGKIAVGYHADLVVFDDSCQYTIKAEDIMYRNKITPYEGKEVCGVVKQTYLRGQPIFSDGAMIGSPLGEPILHTHD